MSNNKHTKRSPTSPVIMQVNTIMRYHLTLKTTKITRAGEIGNLCTAGGNVKWCSCSREQYGGSSKKIKHNITIWSSDFTSGYVPQRTESRDLNRYLYTHVHSSMIHNSPKVEAIQVSTDSWMDKQNVVHPYNGILFNLRRERNSGTCYDVDEPWGHYARWKKPNMKG